MKRTDSLIILLLFISSLALYLRTLAPGLLFGDSAEFQTIAYTLGMGHPTGYPVYVVLAKMATLVPIGEIAYRVNLLSAFSASLTVSLLYMIIRTLGPRPGAAFLPSITWALVPLFWKYACMAEVYSVSMACLAMILFTVLAWSKSKNTVWLFAAGTLGGLSLGLHAMIALLFPAILLYLGITPASSKERWMDRAKAIMLGGTAGILIFLTLFLLLDQRNSPAGYYNSVVIPSLSAWEMKPADFDSPWERFAFLFFPPQFRGQFGALPFPDAINRLKDFVFNNASLLMFGTIGFISFHQSDPKKPGLIHLRWLMLAALVLYTAFAVSYDDFSYPVYHLPSILVLAILAGLGLQRLGDLGKPLGGSRSAVITFAIALIYLLSLRHLWAEVPRAWQDGIPPGLQYRELLSFRFPGINRLNAERTVNHVEDNAVIFTDWDRLYSLYYVSHVLQGRISLDFHQINPQKDQYLPGESMIAYIDENLDHRPLYFTRYPASLESRYQIIAVRPELYQVKRK
ncbi:MAG: DUF2723 domain-containing protein [Chloroflexi bacterium]|nr:DUF2723 domain-containing protein [Chloroflexota bacterium]